MEGLEFILPVERCRPHWVGGDRLDVALGAFAAENDYCHGLPGPSRA